MHWRWKNFQPREVLSPVGMREYHRGNLLFQEFALDRFQRLRSWLGSPLYANHGWLTLRGYRSPQENKKTGGAVLSRHLQGIALDLTSEDLSSHELFRKVKEAAHGMGFGGIGHYPASNFVHVDCRPIVDGQLIIWEK